MTPREYNAEVSNLDLAVRRAKLALKESPRETEALRNAVREAVRALRRHESNRFRVINMGAKISAEMRAARKLVEAGQSAYAAAKATGLTQGAISKSQWYKDYIAKQGAKNVQGN